MLKEVALKEICGNDDMNEVKIESFSSGSIDCASEELDNIIRSSIGIQVSLADILIGKKDDESSNDLVSFISLRKNVCEQRQLEQIKKVFQSVHKVLDHNDKLIACEVYGPKEEAVNIFKLALEGGELGEWINWFYSCENADDCKRRGLYKYIGKAYSREQISRLRGDAFFEYMLYSGTDKIRQPGFYVSQYKLDEIESIPYINELFSAVENLYVLVSKCESENGEINYEKYLTWDRIKI